MGDHLSRLHCAGGSADAATGNQAVSILPSRLPPVADPRSKPPVPGLPSPQSPIPNIVHYIHLKHELKAGEKQQEEDIPYSVYLSMRSAIVTLKPDKILFHCRPEPRGFWWDRIMADRWMDEAGEIRGKVEVVPARHVEWVGEGKRPVEKLAHKADVLRLEILLKHGGIYLDTDTYILRPFTDYGLMQQDIVMALQASPGGSILAGPHSQRETDPRGLCNAIIVAQPGAEFLKRWQYTYETGFDGSRWDYNSIVMPWLLAKMYPTLITVLSDRAFFWPLWTHDHVKAIHETADYDFEATGQLAYHAWGSQAKEYFDLLNPATMRTGNSSFIRMARRFQSENEERDWLVSGHHQPSRAGA